MLNLLKYERGWTVSDNMAPVTPHFTLKSSLRALLLDTDGLHIPGDGLFGTKLKKLCPLGIKKLSQFILARVKLTHNCPRAWLRSFTSSSKQFRVFMLNTCLSVHSYCCSVVSPHSFYSCSFVLGQKRAFTFNAAHTDSPCLHPLPAP